MNGLMTRSRRGAFVLLLSFAAVAAHQVTAFADDDVPPPEAMAYYRNELKASVLSSLRNSAAEFGFTAPVRDIEFGELVPTYTLTREFVRGAAVRGSAAFSPTGEWIAAVGQSGRWRNVVGIAVVEGEWTRSTLGYGPDLATRLGSVQAGDRVVYEMPPDAWYRVRGDEVSALNEPADAILPRPRPVAAYQGIVVQRYAGSDKLPEGSAGGGGGLAAPEPFSPWLIVLSAGLALALPAGLVLARRRWTAA